MKSKALIRFVMACALICLPGTGGCAEEKKMEKKEIVLPAVKIKGEMSVEEAIAKRRSRRAYTSRKLTQEQIGQLLWAASGITDKSRGYRAAPSAGATYPMEVYAVTAEGLFHYVPAGHKLVLMSGEDLRPELSRACLRQSFVAEVPLDIVIGAEYRRTTGRYGKRGEMYVHIEAGHIAQNIHLEAAALGLGSVPVGAFDPGEVKKVLNLPGNIEPIYVIPVGYSR